ncbi:MAG: glycosyltransferase [Gammaproteobacteria bacterium]
MINIIHMLNMAIFVYFTLLCLGYTVLLMLSIPKVLQQFQEVKYGNISNLVNGKFPMPVTIIMPAYNISDKILNAVHSILKSDYKDLNIIVINDGSTDDTLSELIRTFNMFRTPIVVKQKIKTARLLGSYASYDYPRLTVLDKEHSNAGDTLNAGINACRTPIFITIDADTVIETEAVSRIVFSFLTSPHCVATGGVVLIGNENVNEKGMLEPGFRVPNNLVAGLQVAEYMRSFVLFRSGWDTFGGALSFAGAFTLFEKEAVTRVGGFDENNFAQDAEIVLRLHDYMRQQKYPYSIAFAPSAFALTLVPGNLIDFWKQRDHWQRGLLRSFCLHRRMMFNPRYGWVGMFSYPFYVFFEILSPLIELSAYILLILGVFVAVIPLNVILLFFGLAAGYVGALTMATIFINAVTFNKYPRFIDVIHILSLSFADMILFRQCHVLCKSIATGRYLVNRLMGERL